MRGKPSFAGMLLDDNACTAVAVSAFPNIQEGDQRWRELEEETERRSSSVCLVSISFFSG